MRMLLRVLYIFPINRKRIFFSSYEGNSISCNPKYIYKRLYEIYGQKLEYIWECNNVPKECAENVIYVSHNSLKYIFFIMTSKVLVSNTGISALFPLRKDQLVINTWHGAGCYKKAGVDFAETNNQEYRKRQYYVDKNLDYYLSGCAAWTDVFSKAVLVSPKKFLPTGSPRVDMLINGVDKEFVDKVKDAIKIDRDIRVVLYAPTYRGDRHSPEEAKCPIDVKKLLAALNAKFGGNWIFAYRCHYATASQFASVDNSIDLSNYADMQDLLCIADVLISDYSSSIWDFSFTGKPCFLFCYDLHRYTDQRDFYMPIMEWHFPVSTNMNELLKQIKTFSEKDFIEGMKLHHRELGSYEKGDATEQVVKLVSKVLQ